MAKILPTPLVRPIQFNGEWVYSKRRPNTKETRWHRFQTCIAKILPPVFRPTVTSGGPESLRQEAARYKIFAEAGVSVPVVLSLTDDELILSDMGPQLRWTLDTTDSEPEKRRLLHIAIAALGHLHKAGLCHGRPLPRDMTIQGEAISFIDLEEDPTSVMSLADAQARDLWLFMSGVADFSDAKGHFLQQLYYTYEIYAPYDAVTALKAMVRFLGSFTWIAQYLIAPFAGKDVRRAIMANKALARVFKRTHAINQV